MPTECTADAFRFEPLDRREVVSSFDGGTMTADAGVLLLGETDRAIGLIDRFAGCFRDHRDPDLIEHSVRTLVGQRVFGIALGYEDLNDHDELRHDRVMGILAGKLDPERKNCAAVAGKSTLNRLERSLPMPTRYHKIDHDPAAIEGVFVDLFLDAHQNAPKEIICDLDATDDPMYGDQEGKFFHGYYKCHCYLPLFIFCGRHLLAAKLRTSDIDGAAGAKDEMERIITKIRKRWPKVRIILRGDSGFCRDDLMSWCEENDVDYIFGVGKTARLVTRIASELAEAEAEHRATNLPARRFNDFMWTTLDSWNRERRVIAKAEWTEGKSNPRFIVTTLSIADGFARHLYEKVYCARGEMENRLKECKNTHASGRTSTATLRANQLRLWFSAMSYVMTDSLRRLGLAETELADATSDTIRDTVLKIGALVTVSVRRIKLAMDSTCPHKETFAAAYLAIPRTIGTS
jgi:Transposase DDE domain group 1